MPRSGSSTTEASTPRTIAWIGGIDGFARLIDQTLLPTRLEYRDCRSLEEIWEAIRCLRTAVALLQSCRQPRLEYRDCRSLEEIWEAIRCLRVRGAPAIGIAAALGVVLGMQRFKDRSRGAYVHRLWEVTEYLRTSRPTAVNLFWALERMQRRVQGFTELWPPDRLTGSLLEEALAIEEEDRCMCRAIGAAGQSPISRRRRRLTPCNARAAARA